MSSRSGGQIRHIMARNASFNDTNRERSCARIGASIQLTSLSIGLGRVGEYPLPKIKKFRDKRSNHGNL